MNFTEFFGRIHISSPGFSTLLPYLSMKPDKPDFFLHKKDLIILSPKTLRNLTFDHIHVVTLGDLAVHPYSVLLVCITVISQCIAVQCSRHVLIQVGARLTQWLWCSSTLWAVDKVMVPFIFLATMDLLNKTQCIHYHHVSDYHFNRLASVFFGQH